jgi:16S rRNA (guanine527-N7)-methyltransferase
MESLELLEAQAAEWGVRLDDGKLDRLLRYGRILASYEKANVIGTRELDPILIEHILDSLSCFLHEPVWEAGRLADVGSGGGLPGIPISIVRPDLRTTLIESTGKKAGFLRHAAEHLALGSLDVVNARVEDVSRMHGQRGAFGIVTTRAVARLSVVAEYCVPLLEVGGQAVAMKAGLEGEEYEEGRRATGALGARVAGVEPVDMLMEVGEKERNLVILEKIRETPARYPRKAGMVTKRPLGVREQSGRAT